jgi:hypothetical protein
MRVPQLFQPEFPLRPCPLRPPLRYLRRWGSVKDRLSLREAFRTHSSQPSRQNTLYGGRPLVLHLEGLVHVAAGH